MLLQTNSYVVPKERRAEHARIIRRFRQALARIGCDQFEVYEQVGANWSPGGANGRYVQIMRFRDRQHQQAVQAAERTDHGAQQIIAEFCELINFPYQHQHGYFATGFYTSVLPIGPRQAIDYQPEDGYENQAAADGVEPVKSAAIEEIDAPEFQSTSVPRETEYAEKQVTPEPEPEADLDLGLDDASETLDERSDVESAHPLSASPEAVSEQEASSLTSPDFLGEDDLQLEPEAAEDIASTAQISRSDFGSLEMGLSEPAIPTSSDAPMADEFSPENALFAESETSQAVESALESPDESAVEGEFFDVTAEFPEPQPQASALGEPSPEADVLPAEAAPQIWSAPAVSDSPEVEHAALDQPHPIGESDATQLEQALPVHGDVAANSEAAMLAVDESDALDSGLIFDDEPAAENTPPEAEDGLEFDDHAFAFDKPQAPHMSPEDSLRNFASAGDRHEEISSLELAQDDLMPPPMDPEISGHDPLAADSGYADRAGDALLDDAHLLESVAMSGELEPTAKVRAAHESSGVPGIDGADEKDAELIEFDAMMRDLQDPSAEHGSRAH